jgi:hypothetical protein
MMQRRIFVDRSLVQLFSEDVDGLSIPFRNLISAMDRIFYEAAGSSALEKKLAAHRDHGIKLTPVLSQDSLILSEAQKVEVRTFIGEAVNDPLICAAIGQYAHRTMSLRFDPEDVLSYVVRLVLFSLGTKADLACSWERAEMIRRIAEERECLLEQSDNQFEIDPTKLIGLTTAAPGRLRVVGVQALSEERPKASSRSKALQGKRFFINYRRSDVAGFVHAIHAWLISEIPSEQIFLDVDSAIQAGDNFPEVLRRRVIDADIVLCLLGERWLALLKERATSNSDYVVIELELALKEEKKIVPVLIGNANMPRAEELPEAIRELSTRQAVRIRDEAFRMGCFNLIKSLDAAIANG